jgi:hypothetical protein
MADPGTDPLSSLAHDLIKSASYNKLVVPEGTPSSATNLLGSIAPDQLLTVPITSYPHASAMLAGLWLWHDSLDECHKIAQKEPEHLRRSAPNPHQIPSKPSLKVYFVESVESDNGLEMRNLRDATESLAFWHAIMHRREGDFSNSKYWFARCRGHAVLGTMASYANDILHPLPADKSLLRLMRNGWDPDAFVDLTEQVYDRPDDARHGAAVALQRIEWRLLFNHCARSAAGK